MAKGSKIIVSSNPKGVFLEGIISGTPKPGVVMQIKAATVPIGGRHTWEVTSKSDGAKQLVAVLLEDDKQGKVGVGTPTTFTPSAAVGGGTYYPPGDAYVTGTRCFLYCPAAGEELNMQCENQSGTTDDVAIADLFGIDATDGSLIANSAFASPCFTALEAVTDPTADFMLWVMFNGH